jgi:hypothetical protein
MMAITGRLQRLEQRIPRHAPPRSYPSPVQFVEDWLARKGIVRQGMESLADAFARSLGITPLALRTLLQQRAAGLPAE